MYKFLRLSLLLSVISNVISVAPDVKIGKFDLRLNDIDKCKGPKQKECGNIALSVYNSTTLFYDLHLNRTMRMTHAKVVVQTNGRDLVRLQLAKPCEHIIIKEVINTAFKLSTKNCAIPPGHYEMAFNLDKIAQDYYGGSFMYGNYSFKTLFLSTDCNVSCLTVHVSFLPKTKN